MNAVAPLASEALAASPAACPKSPPDVRAGGMTHVGRVRKVNEDQFLIAEMARTLAVRATSLPQPALQYSSCRGHVFLLADGLGGHQSGETASSLTMLTLETFLLNALKRFFCVEAVEEEALMREFQAALLQADARIFEEAAGHPELFGMGTTLTMAFVVNWQLFIAHVGDSRCYLLRGDQFEQLTHDHTFVAELVDRGLLSREEAAHSKYRNMITNAVGGKEKGLRVELHKRELLAADTIVLCSDGLHGALSDERIARVVRDEANAPQKACERLVQEVNDLGGKDNITVIVARFQEGERQELKRTQE
jgi:protein phosphatase